MLYTFGNVVVKSNDWKIADIKGADGVITREVSINRTNSKGEVFPRFDEIANDVQLEGNLWSSSTGKKYLYAPKTFTKKSGGNSVAIAQAQEFKAESIKKAQDHTSYSVKVSGTARDATLITIELLKQDSLADWHTVWNEVRDRLWDMYDREIPDKPIF